MSEKYLEKYRKNEAERPTNQKNKPTYNCADYLNESKEFMQWYSDFLWERYRQAEKELAGDTAKP